MADYLEYQYNSAEAGHQFRYLMRPILELAAAVPPPASVLDVGCGNGYLVGEFQKRGYRAVGIDLSEQGIAIARQAHPDVRFELLAADENVLTNLGEPPFDLVLSTEVVEHLYDPRAYARGCFAALRPGGRFICSTPYHGYLKNLAIAVTGGYDNHVRPLWDGGHIKFWSRATLAQLLRETGFTNVQFRGAGRAPYLWMSMVMSGDKPATPAPPAAPPPG